MFYELHESEMDHLFKNCLVKEYEDKVVIHAESQKHENILVVLTGHAIWYREENKKKMDIQKLNAGDFFGEYLFTNLDSTKEILRASGKCTILEVSFDDLKKVFKEDSEIYALIITNILRYSMQKQDQFNGLISRVFMSDEIPIRTPIINFDRKLKVPFEK